MKKRILSLLLALALMLAVFPVTVAAADEAARIDLSTYYLRIEEDGYCLKTTSSGGWGAKVPHTGDYYIYQSGTGSTIKYITVGNGTHTIILHNVNMQALQNGQIDTINNGVNATINLILEGENKLASNGTVSIHVPKNVTLNISGSGSLNVRGGKWGDGRAAIGSSSTYGDCGTINILGGTITAQGGTASRSNEPSAPAIGGGQDGTGSGTRGKINISGPNTYVYATGGDGAAAIGSGPKSRAGVDISITNGATVEAYSTGVAALGKDYSNLLNTLESRGTEPDPAVVLDTLMLDDSIDLWAQSMGFPLVSWTIIGDGENPMLTYASTDTNLYGGVVGRQSEGSDIFLNFALWIREIGENKVGDVIEEENVSFGDGALSLYGKAVRTGIAFADRAEYLGWAYLNGKTESVTPPTTSNSGSTQGSLLNAFVSSGLLFGEELPFTDVSANDWFYDAVFSAWEHDLLDGVTANYFKPNSTLTVAQAIKLAAALHQKTAVGFVTLQNGGQNWYSTFVEYAVANGLIEEKYLSYTPAQMNAPVTRAEFVHILFGNLTSAQNVNTVNSIPDVAENDAYAAEIYAFYRAGILSGSNRFGTFYPEQSLKRSEAAAILVRLYDAAQRVYITLR